MPVSKKNKSSKKVSKEKKPTKKKVMKKKIDTQKKVKKDIKSAVDKLPGLIIEQVKFENQNYKKSEKSKDVYTPTQKFSRPQINNDDRSKKMLMWLFVFIITAVVFSMWAWNMSVMFKDVGRTKSTNNLLGNVKQSYTEIMASEFANDEHEQKNADKETEIEKDKIKNSLKESLGALLANINTSTDSLINTSTELIDTTETNETPTTTN